MKAKTLLLSLLISVGVFSSCSYMESKEDNMKKAAMQISTDFVNGNIDAFIKALDPSVRATYPADQVLTAQQAITMILGTVQNIDSVATLSLDGLSPMASVIVNYQGGIVQYQSVFNDKGAITAFVPIPMETEEVYSAEEIISIDSIPATTPTN